MIPGDTTSKTVSFAWRFICFDSHCDPSLSCDFTMMKWPLFGLLYTLSITFLLLFPCELQLSNVTWRHASYDLVEGLHCIVLHVETSLSLTYVTGLHCYLGLLFSPWLPFLLLKYLLTFYFFNRMGTRTQWEKLKQHIGFSQRDWIYSRSSNNVLLHVVSL